METAVKSNSKKKRQVKAQEKYYHSTSGSTFLAYIKAGDFELETNDGFFANVSKDTVIIGSEQMHFLSITEPAKLLCIEYPKRLQQAWSVTKLQPKNCNGLYLGSLGEFDAYYFTAGKGGQIDRSIWRSLAHVVVIDATADKKAFGKEITPHKLYNRAGLISNSFEGITKGIAFTT